MAAATSSHSRSEPVLLPRRLGDDDEWTTQLRPDSDDPIDQCDRGWGLDTIDALQHDFEEGEPKGLCSRCGRTPTRPVPHYSLQANDVLPFSKAAPSIMSGSSLVCRAMVHPTFIDLDEWVVSFASE